MKKIFVLTALIGLLFLSACQKTPTFEPFFFIQMTDPQFGMFTGNKGFEKETELFSQAMAAANQLKPKFVIVTGDLINQYQNKEQVAEFWRIAKTLNPEIPFLMTPGNHDILNEPTLESLKWYRTNFSTDWFAFDLNQCRFISLNSGIMQRPEQVSADAEAQEKWLQNEFSKHTGTDYAHTFVFQHHPYFINTLDDKDGYENIPQKIRQTWLDRFVDNGVTAIFMGHHHRNAFAEYRGMELVTTSAVGRPLGDDASGFRIIKVYPNRIEHTYVTLENIPETVKFSE